MAGIKALTPTSAGLAQVFDTSQYVEEKKQSKAQQRDRLNKTMLQYNPKGLMRNHVGAYQKLLEEYQGFVSQNHSNLINSSENMEVWQKKLSYENEIKNFVAGSTQMNQNYSQALPMVLKDDSYINPENEQFLEDLQKEATVEQFRNGDLFVPVLKELDRNYLVNEDKLLASARELMSAETELELGGEPGFDVIRTTQRLDNEAFNEWVNKKFNEKSRDGGDIRNRYGDEDTFRQSIEDRIVEQEKVSYSRQPQVKTEDAPSPRDQVAFQPLSSPKTYVAAPITVTDTDVEATRRQRLGKDPMPTKESTVQYQLRETDAYAINAEPKGGITITTQVPTAYNLSTGKYEDIPKAMNSMKVLQVGMYNIANETITVKRKGQPDLIVQEGQPIPDRWNDDVDMTDDEWYTLLGKTTETEMAKAFVSTTPLELMEQIGIEETRKLIEKEGSSNKMVLIDYSEVHEDVAGAYGRATKLDYNLERNDYLTKNRKLTR